MKRNRYMGLLAMFVMATLLCPGSHSPAQFTEVASAITNDVKLRGASFHHQSPQRARSEGQAGQETAARRTSATLQPTTCPAEVAGQTLGPAHRRHHRGNRHCRSDCRASPPSSG